MYKIWLRGTDTRFTWDSASEVVGNVAGDIPPGEIMQPAETTFFEDNNAGRWISLDVWGLSPEDQKEGEEYTTPGNVVMTDPAQRRVYEVQVDAYNFPTGMADLDTLMGHLRKRYIYIFNRDYPYTFHSADKIVAVSHAYETTHEYADGTKVVTLTLKKRERN